MELNELKKSYESLAKKHKLPSFDELNRNFEIEKIERESDILLRIVRVVMMDKVIATQRFVESILVPGNAPRMLYAYLKAMSESDRVVLQRIYDAFAALTLEVLELDVEYDEKKEAAMIMSIFSVWNKTKKEIYAVIGKIKTPEKGEAKKEKSYFG